MTKRAIVLKVHYDSLGTTRNLSDSTATISDSYFYEGFGEILGSDGTTENTYLFTGEQYDEELNNYYLRARYYNQGVGRFKQMDTFDGFDADPMSLNKYVYGSSEPINNSDPSGYVTLCSLSTGIKNRMRLATINKPRPLNLGYYSTKGTTRVVQAGVLLCLGQMVSSMVGNDVITSDIANGNEGCKLNRMRVQLQQGSTHTTGIPSVATPNPGVSVNQVRGTLNQLYLGRSRAWFPKELDKWMYQSIVSISIKLGRIPPLGVRTTGRDILREQTFLKGKSYRIDVENLRGHNLRR